MAKEKQYVFSARTTEEGLKVLNEVKMRLKVSWDDLVIEAVSAHYGLDKAMMSLPKKEKPAKEAPTSRQPPEDRASEAVGLKPSEEKHTTKQGAEKTKRNKKKG
jgi:hypothetical protein